MPIDLTSYSDIPKNWSYDFCVEGVSHAHAKQALEDFNGRLDASGMHPFTGYMAYDELSHEWDEIVNSEPHWEELLEHKPICAWEDTWSEALDAAMASACRNLQGGAVSFQCRIDWPGAQSDPVPQTYFMASPQAAAANKKAGISMKPYRYSGFFREAAKAKPSDLGVRSVHV